jgi:hypothetical protein
MGAADGACLHRGASLMDADANMNTKRRPEEVTCSEDVAATVTTTSVRKSVVLKETADTEPKVGDGVNYVPRWRWPDLTVQLFVHFGCLYGFYLIFTSVKLLTTVWGESLLAVHGTK